MEVVQGFGWMTKWVDDGWGCLYIGRTDKQVGGWFMMDKWSPSSLGMSKCFTFASFPLPLAPTHSSPSKSTPGFILSVLLNKSQISNWLVRTSSILIVRHASEWLRSWGDLEKSPRCWEKMRNMTFWNRNQFYLTKTVASVNYIINPIYSHNAMISSSQKTEVRGEEEKGKREMKNLAEIAKVIFPFKNNCFDSYDN